MKITKHKDPTGLGSYVKFEDKNVRGVVWHDGSGALSVGSKIYIQGGDWHSESGTHKQRCRDIGKLAKMYSKAYKQLIKINKKINEKS